MTYHGPGAVHVNIDVARVSMNVTRNFDQNSDPLVQGVGGKVVL